MDGHPRHVLILRPDNLGDVVLFSGALRHIRRHYPQAEITLCVRRYVLNYVELCPHVDRLLCWEDVFYNLTERPTLDWLPEVRGRWRLQTWLRSVVRQVMRQRYRTDVLLVPVRSPTPAMHAIARMIPARAKFGIAGEHCNQTPAEDQAAERFYTARLRLPPERRADHELTVTREFLELLGMDISLGNLWPEVWPGEVDRAWAENTIANSNRAITFALCPGVTNTTKLYPVQNYALILKRLARWRFKIVLFGSPSEHKVCQDVTRVLADCENVEGVMDLCGRTSLQQLVEGLRRCDIVLSVDSAALHIAVALNKPVVGIMGGGHYGRFYPWGDPDCARTVSLPLDCYWCNWQCQHATVRCIQEIAPQSVAEQLEALLKRMEDGAMLQAG